MVQVWQNYLSDLGRAYPLFSLSISQVNDSVSTSLNPLDLLPNEILTSLINVKYPCQVKLLVPRTLILWASDGGQFRVTYPVPFSEDLANYLVANLQVQAFEFVGERIKDGRLRRMLPNV